jgi:hypothetical protein
MIGGTHGKCEQFAANIYIVGVLLLHKPSENVNGTVVQSEADGRSGSCSATLQYMRTLSHSTPPVVPLLLSFTSSGFSCCTTRANSLLIVIVVSTIRFEVT